MIAKIKTARALHFSLSMAVSMAFMLVAATLPADAKPLYTTKAKYAILMDADTGAILYSKKPDQLMPPASMSKLMTAAMLFKALKAGELKLDGTLRVSENAWRKGGGPSGTASMFAPLNKDILVSDLLQGIVVQSGNDACIIVAEGLAGSEEAFAEQMTREARRIGLKKSTFGNSTGLPNDKQLMTARELALLAHHLIKEYPEYYHYFGQKLFKYRKFRFHNRNPLVFKYGADGLKTGYTKKAGYGLVSSAQRKGRRLIAVVSGLSKKRHRKKESERLLDWGFNGFQTYKVFPAESIVGHARVLGGSHSYVPLVGNSQKGVNALLPRYMSAKKVPARIVYQGPLKAPVMKGDQVAHLEIKAQGVVENRIPLFAAEDVQRSNLFWRGLDTLLFLAFGWLF